MQGLADGYFVLPNTIASFLAPRLGTDPVPADHPSFAAAEAETRDLMHRLLTTNGSRTVDWFHRELGTIMLEHCGMSRSAAGLRTALAEIPELREQFYADVKVPGDGISMNQSLEKAGRVCDFFELAELMCRDALYREESCGGHFRLEHQTAEGEALRNDEDFSHVAAWGFTETGSEPTLTIEELDFEYVKLAQRSYK